MLRNRRPRLSKGLIVKKVKTADQMFDQIKKSLPVDIAVCAAAVSDFKVKEISKNKIKKNKNDIQKNNGGKVFLIK